MAVAKDASGKSQGSLLPIAFEPPEHTIDVHSRDMDDPDMDLPSLSLLYECFPALSELKDNISSRCGCRTCRMQKGGVPNDWKDGCLCLAAMDHFFMLIGNAIADGLGIGDASGLLNYDDYVLEVRISMGHLVQGFLPWDLWFNIAASTALGYSPKGVLFSEGSNKKALVAIQYGSTSLKLSERIDALQWRLRRARSLMCKGSLCFCTQLRKWYCLRTKMEQCPTPR